jgi:hypothetical protein
MNAALSKKDQDLRVDQFIESVGAVDGILQAQSFKDASYFTETVGR